MFPIITAYYVFSHTIIAVLRDGWICSDSAQCHVCLLYIILSITRTEITLPLHSYHYIASFILLLMTNSLTIGQCKLNGCTKKVCVEDGRVHEFCCYSHAKSFRDKEAEQSK